MVEEITFKNPGCLREDCVSYCLIEPIILDVLNSANGSKGGYDGYPSNGFYRYTMFKKSKIVGRYERFPDFENSECRHRITHERKLKEQMIKEKVLYKLEQTYCRGFFNNIFCGNPEKGTERCGENHKECEIYYKIRPLKEIPVRR